MVAVCIEGRMPSCPKVNIQGIVEDWAYDYFHRRASRSERNLLKKDYIDVEIDWKRVRFIHDDPIYDPEPSGSSSSKPLPVSNLLFSTEFTNRTDASQMYSFRADRTTRSSCSVVIEQCYTFGVDMNVRLATPNDLLELNVGFKREMALTNSETETIEEEMTWGVDSQIEVKEGHVAKAKLVVLEEEYQGEFIIRTHVSGRIRAVFRNAKDGHSFIRAIEGDVVEVVRQAAASRGFGAGSAVLVVSATKTVLCRTKGRCKFKYGVKQVIEVDQVPINRDII